MFITQSLCQILPQAITRKQKTVENLMEYEWVHLKRVFPGTVAITTEQN